MTTKKRIRIAPSILSADFAHLGEQVADADRAGADYIHVDIMDGHFVPNITIGAPVVAALRGCTELPLDVHLMIEHPECYIVDFASAGADIITVHVEACSHLHRVISAIKETGRKAGVALNPATPLNSIEEILPHVDLALIMSVNPGFGGQTFIPSSLDKVNRLRQTLDSKSSGTEIEVDGGINLGNVLSLCKAGADVIAVGNSVFKAEGGISKAIEDFRRVIS